jgi:hypothetical protein
LLVCSVDDPSANEKIYQWLNESKIKTLNVAGSSESRSPGIGERVYALLRPIFEDL